MMSLTRTLILLCLLGSLPAAAPAQSQNPGGLDTTFAPGSITGFEIFSLVLQSDGKIVIGGNFSSVNGSGRTGLARILDNGAVDPGFVPDIYNSGNNGGGQVNSIALLPDGKMVIGGVYTAVNGVTRNGPVRLNADGSLDARYDTTDNEYYVNGLQYAVAVQPDDKVLVGVFNGIERTNFDGSADNGFKPSSSDGSYNTGSNDVNGSQVFAIALQPDGKILIGGHFVTFAGVMRPDLARLNADGTLDTSFQPAFDLDPSGAITSVVVQPGGKILYSGRDYDPATGKSPGILGRLNPDGSEDLSFQEGFTADLAVNTVALQGDGKILIGGRFNTVRGAAHKGFARLNADGSLDTAFVGGIDTAGALNDFVYGLAIQPNGKIVIGGAFEAVDGTPRSKLARLLGEHLPFFDGEAALNGLVEYLAFPNQNIFGYYAYLEDPHYIYHYDLGFEYAFDAANGHAGVYFYDFASNGFFYTSPTFSFPYLYDFTLGSVLYYYPDPDRPGRYDTNGVRYFYEFKTGQIISK